MRRWRLPARLRELHVSLPAVVLGSLGDARIVRKAYESLGEALSIDHSDIVLLHTFRDVESGWRR